MKTLILTALITITGLFAGDAPLSRGFGLAAGMITGSGFSYRQVNENHGFQISFGLMKFDNDGDYDYSMYHGENYYYTDSWVPDTTRIYTNNVYSGGETFGNIGLIYIKPLHRGKRSMFFAMAGISTYFSAFSYTARDYRYHILTDSTYSYLPEGSERKENENEFTYLVGAGIGIELQLTENIRISGGLPLTYTSRGTITMFVPQAGVHYYFK